MDFLAIAKGALDAVVVSVSGGTIIEQFYDSNKENRETVTHFTCIAAC